MWFKKLIKLLRYRFFLFAGMLPYILGQIVAYNQGAGLDWSRFGWGLGGLFLVLAAVELFNEYFDARAGGDRIFSQEEVVVPRLFFPLGMLALAAALATGVKLALLTGWPVILFCVVGFLGAYFYVGPPLRWAYRGMGEVVIALCYGPFMVMGSYYIQARRFAFAPFYVSLLCGLSVFSLAIVNEIPDYYQDKLVDKLNLVVRLGKRGALRLLKFSFIALLILLVIGAVLGQIPLPAGGTLVMVAPVLSGIRRIEKNYDNPDVFLFAVNTFVISHIVLLVFLGIGFLKGQIR